MSKYTATVPVALQMTGPIILFFMRTRQSVLRYLESFHVKHWNLRDTNQILTDPNRMFWYTLSFTVPPREEGEWREARRTCRPPYVDRGVDSCVFLHVKTVNTQQTTCTDVSRLSFCAFRIDERNIMSDKTGRNNILLVYGTSYSYIYLFPKKGLSHGLSSFGHYGTSSDAVLYNLLFNDIVSTARFKSPRIPKDDIILVAKSAADLKQMLEELDRISKEAGFSMNPEKTKLMTNTSEDQIHLNGQPLEYVEDYTYLGQNLSFSSNSEKEIK
ncbi:hypothetical protein ANN_05203 [Periplaneta americana]|uniref:Reverse transcriptase domain-containing protein n=1 Tax=Periplaneta americana TaxID=6978 RepID=A0ABQ8TAG0_PERAM|nr:hypothetical protein ANN_05203 [Periplaneta americana]